MIIEYNGTEEKLAISDNVNLGRTYVTTSHNLCEEGYMFWDTSMQTAEEVESIADRNRISDETIQLAIEIEDVLAYRFRDVDGNRDGNR